MRNMMNSLRWQLLLRLISKLLKLHILCVPSCVMLNILVHCSHFNQCWCTLVPIRSDRAPSFDLKSNFSDFTDLPH